MLHIKSISQQNLDRIQSNFPEFLQACLLDRGNLNNYLEVLDAELILSLIENFVCYAADRSRWLDIEAAQRRALFELSLHILQNYIEPNILLLTQIENSRASEGFLSFVQLINYIDEQRPSPGDTQQDFMQQINELIKLQATISNIALKWIGFIDIHTVDAQGNTALHLIASGTCCRSEEEITTALLKRGALTDSLNLKDQSALDIAVAHNKEPVLKAMVSQKALGTAQLLNLINDCKNGNFRLCGLIPVLMQELSAADYDIETMFELLEVLYSEFDRQAIVARTRTTAISLVAPIASVLEAILQRLNSNGVRSAEIFSRMHSVVNSDHKLFICGRALRALALNLFAKEQIEPQQNLLHYLAFSAQISATLNEQLFVVPFEGMANIAANIVKAAKFKTEQGSSVQEIHSQQANFAFILFVFQARQAAGLIIDDSTLTSVMRATVQKGRALEPTQRTELKQLLDYLNSFMWPKYERRLYADLCDVIENLNDPSLSQDLGLSKFNTWSRMRPFMGFMSRAVQQPKEELAAEKTEQKSEHNQKYRYSLTVK